MSGAQEKWAGRQHDQRVADLGPDLACEFEALALDKAAGIRPIADVMLTVMTDAYRIGLGHRNPVSVQRLQSITRAWHRDACGCVSADCSKRAGIARFVEG